MRDNVLHAIDICIEAFAKRPEAHGVLAFSGGKDSTAILKIFLSAYRRAAVRPASVTKTLADKVLTGQCRGISSKQRRMRPEHEGSGTNDMATIVGRSAVMVWRILAIAGSILGAAISTSSAAQWYQGPSGATGGQVFDGWVANGHATNIRRLLVMTAKLGGAIQCVEALYPNQPADPQSGFVGAAGPDSCNVNNPADTAATLSLDPDEYILGVSGTYSDHVSSLRFYTNKKNSPVYGDSGPGKVFGYTAPHGEMIVALIQANDFRLRSLGVMYAACDAKTKMCK